MLNRKSWAIVVFFLVGSIAGFLLRSAIPSRDPARDALAARADALEREKEDLSSAIEKLLSEGRSAKKDGEALGAEDGQEEAKAKADGKDAQKRTPSASRGRKRDLPYHLGSADEADGIFQDAMARGDLEGLMGLAAALLELGEDGYAKLADLFVPFEEKIREDPAFGELLDKPLLAGQFLRALADNDESLLRFALYLENSDPETLPKPLQEVRRELGRSELRPILLGFYEGGDPDIEKGFLDVFQRELEAENEGRRMEEAVQGLAQLHSEESTDLLLGLIQRSPSPNVLPGIVMALGIQGNRKAIPALQELRSATEDARAVAAIDAAIRLLESPGQ